MPSDSLISVVIVTHQSAATIVRCIESVLASSAEVEVVVVDNASGDETLDLMYDAWGGEAGRAQGGSEAQGSTTVNLLANADNLGFARACNQGAALAQGTHLLFLNPDAFVGTSDIGKLAAHLRSGKRIGLVGCHVIDESGLTHGPLRRREPTWWRGLMTVTGLSRLDYRWPVLAGVEAGRDSDDGGASSAKIEDVDAVNGAVMMLPREAFDSIGGFDEAFMLHAEDLDLCRRLRDAGWRVVLANDVKVVHIGGVSSRRRRFWVEWQKTRSLWRYFQKHESTAGVLIAGIVFLGLSVRLITRLLLLPLRALHK